MAKFAVDKRMNITNNAFSRLLSIKIQGERSIYKPGTPFAYQLFGCEFTLFLYRLLVMALGYVAIRNEVNEFGSGFIG